MQKPTLLHEGEQSARAHLPEASGSNIRYGSSSSTRCQQRTSNSLTKGLFSFLGTKSVLKRDMDCHKLHFLFSPTLGIKVTQI